VLNYTKIKNARSVRKKTSVLYMWLLCATIGGQNGYGLV